jgi:hypothetical protein
MLAVPQTERVQYSTALACKLLVFEQKVDYIINLAVSKCVSVATV